MLRRPALFLHKNLIGVLPRFQADIRGAALRRFLSASGLRRRGKPERQLYPSQDFSVRCESDGLFAHHRLILATRIALG